MKKEKQKKLWPLCIIFGIIRNPIIYIILFIIILIRIDEKTVDTHVGMDYYFEHNAIGYVELTECWIPQEDYFWNNFNYTEADFWFERKYQFNETCILYVKYDEKEYSSAKTFVSNNANLCYNHIYQYNETIFIENLDLAIDHGFLRNGESTFHNWGNYFGYNDSKCVLFFIGFFISDKNNPFGNNITSSEVFIFDLERYFYNFIELF